SARQRYSRSPARAIECNPRALGPRTANRHAARLDRYRRCARLHRAVVRGRELRRPNSAVWPRRTLATLHLSALTGELLHLLDLLLLRPPPLAPRLRFFDHLHRSDSFDWTVLAIDHAHRALGQGSEYHLDCLLHRRPLRQSANRRCRRGADRDHRHDSVHSAAAESGFLVTDDHPV